MNIFQKDGQREYILKGWKIKLYLTKDLKTQDQLRALPWQGIALILATGLTLGIHRFCQGYLSTGNYSIMVHVFIHNAITGRDKSLNDVT